MKRLGVCILLFAFVIAASVSCVVTVTHCGESLLQELNEIDRLTEKVETEKVLAACEQLAKEWESKRTALYVFVDHESFFDLDSLLPILPEVLKESSNRAKEQIVECRELLEDMIARQQPNIGNIL